MIVFYCVGDKHAMNVKQIICVAKVFVKPIELVLFPPKGRDTLGDKSLRHVAGTSRRNKPPCVTRLISWKSLSLRQNFVSAISRTNSNQFEFVRLIAATKLALLHRVYTSCNKSLRQNINEPTRELHMVSHIELEN